MSQSQLFVDPREIEFELNIIDRGYLAEPQPIYTYYQQLTSTSFYLQHHDADCTSTQPPSEIAQASYHETATQTTLTASHLQQHEADCTQDYNLDDYTISPHPSDSSNQTDASSSPASTTATSPSTSFHDAPTHSPRNTYYNHQCTDCGRAYSLPGELQKHRNAMHNKRYKCGDCGRAFGLKTDLKKHTLKHLRPEEKSGFLCEFEEGGVKCGKSFPRKDNMLKHMRKIHKAR